MSSSTQAETRAEFAERSVAKLEKTIDDLEGMNLFRLTFKTLCKNNVWILYSCKSTKQSNNLDRV